MKDVKNRRYRFDQVEIDVQSLRVTVDSQNRPLEPKSFRLLLFLVENPGRVLQKDEIMAAVWPDAFVSDNSLARAITQVRKALDDDPKAPRYVVTVPTFGYRFEADFKKEDRNPAEVPETPATNNTPVVFASPVLLTPALPQAGPGLVRVRARVKLAVLVCAVVAFAGLVASGWWLHARKEHALTNKDTVVLADFANSTGDPVFDDALKQGLAVQLGQSPLLNILPEQRVRSALKQMMQAPDQALTASLAQEVCVRTGGKAYIAGSIANLGGHYVIGLNAIHCATGDDLAREQTEAAGKQQVLTALGSAAERLRNKLGESLSSIRKFDVPLAQATTPSLEALKAYSFGLTQFGKGDPADAVPLLQQAVELDPDFAIAYANLGRAYENLGRRQPMDEALRKAFALRGRTSEREKFDISAVYYQMITNQTDAAVENCELWERTYPLDLTPHRILGYEYGMLGRLEQSAGEFARAKELDPGQAIPYAGLMLDYMALNRLAEARTVYEEAQARKVGLSGIYRHRYLLAFIEDDQATMTTVAAKLTEQSGYKAFLDESATEAYFGRFGHAQELTRRIESLALGEGDKVTAADLEARMALVGAMLGNSAVARDHEAAAVGFGGKPTVATALADDPAAATQMLDRFASDTPPNTLDGKVLIPEIRAAVEIRRGNPVRAVELLAPVAQYEAGWNDRLLAAYLRGAAYLAEHRGPEAATEFRKIVSHPGVVLNEPHGALARLGLARAYALEGDRAQAGAAYQDFLTLWKDADPDIPILIAAKSEYAGLK